MPSFRFDGKAAAIDDSMLAIDDMAGDGEPLLNRKLDSKLFEIKISMLPLSTSARCILTQAANNRMSS